MKIFVEKQNKELEHKFSGTAQELLTSLGINPEAVLVVKNNELVTLDETLSDSDRIKILSVISGG